jgi:hypothetical protein
VTTNCVSGEANLFTRFVREGVTNIRQTAYTKCVLVFKHLRDNEPQMWAKGLLGDADPRTLLNTLVFLFGKFFALQSGEEHRNLIFMHAAQYSWR